MSVADDEIITYFTVLTDLPMAEIEQIADAINGGGNPMEFKKRLAFEITKQYHDEASAQTAQENFEKTVQNKEVPDEIPEISVPRLSTLATILQLAVPEESNSNLRRLVEQGAVTIDDQKMADLTAVIEVGEILKVGKRRYFRLKIK